MVMTHFLMKFHSIEASEADPAEVILNVLDYLSQKGFNLETYSLSDDPADGHKNLRYSRENLTQQLSKFDLDGMFNFKGTYNHKFEFEIDTVEFGTPGNLLIIFVRNIPKKETESLYNIFTHLNKYLNPIYSGAATPWLTKQPESQEYNQMLQVKATQFPRSGPDGIAERTYFSSKLAKIIDVDSLKSIGLDIREDESGIQVDLLKNPWSEEYEVLAQQRKQANVILNNAGILGTYSIFERSKPGSKWTEFFQAHLQSINST